MTTASRSIGDLEKGRHFIFVSFQMVAEAKRAIKLLDGKEFDGRKIQVNRAQFGPDNKRKGTEEGKRTALKGRKIYEKLPNMRKGD